MVEWSGIRTSGTDLDVVTKHVTIIGGNKNIPLLCVPLEADRVPDLEPKRILLSV
jgi:hypothetical protein